MELRSPPVVGAEILAFLLAAVCPGCDRTGTLLCPQCRARLNPAPVVRTTPGGMRVHAALTYEGVPARCIRRLKEEGATMLARPLGAAMARTLAESVAGGGAIVTVPTAAAAFRRRGYRVPELLVRRAGFRPERMLRAVRATRDQRGLGRAARAGNVRGSMAARRGAAGGSAVIVDDVVTTGATLDEAARALEAAGIRPIGAVVLAATPRLDGG